jgi:hypothetical protein
MFWQPSKDHSAWCLCSVDIVGCFFFSLPSQNGNGLTSSDNATGMKKRERKRSFATKKRTSVTWWRRYVVFCDPMFSFMFWFQKLADWRVSIMAPCRMLTRGSGSKRRKANRRRRNSSFNIRVIYIYIYRSVVLACSRRSCEPTSLGGCTVNFVRY